MKNFSEVSSSTDNPIFLSELSGILLLTFPRVLYKLLFSELNVIPFPLYTITPS